MKTLSIGRKLERAQMLPIVVVGVIVMIAMAALLLDGGALILNRRAAQNAADAGAAAGARVLCREATINNTNIYNEIYKYTTTENHATIVDWQVIPVNAGSAQGLAKGEVVVTAKIEQNSFFAKIFNQSKLTSGATAGAGCFPYRPQIILPIAWSCRPPAAGSASDDCDYVKLNWPSVKTIAQTYLSVFPLPSNVEPTAGQAKSISDALYAAHSSSIYIVMDSDKVCGVDIICDFNTGDSIDRYQLSSGGNRGWLNLDGGSGGTSTVAGWITNGLSTEIKPHTWLSGINGNKTPIYNALRTRIDEVVWIPIFNVLCPGLPAYNASCLTAAHSSTPPGVPLAPGQVDTVTTGSPATPVLHVVGFAPFFITCVHVTNGDNCPGFNLAQTTNPSIPNNTNTVEGYFVDPDSLDGENVSLSGADLGFYTVSFTR